MFPAYSVEAQAPWVHNSTRNSRRSEIISHFRPGTGPVRSGAVNSHTPLNQSLAARWCNGPHYLWAANPLPCSLSGHLIKAGPTAVAIDLIFMFLSVVVFRFRMHTRV